MSILIKGMEMPQTCGECPLNVWSEDHEHFCAARPDVRSFDGSAIWRVKHCPLIEVHEPHGKLIDADKLKSYWEPDHSRYFDADYFIHTIDVAQTIIPSSEEG